MYFKTDSSVVSVGELFSCSIDRVSDWVKGYACIPFAWDFRFLCGIFVVELVF